MKKCTIQAGVFFTLLILLPGFKKNNPYQDFSSLKSVTIISKANAELPELHIADATAIQGEKGQTPVEILVCLSAAAAEPVTMEYSTENGSAMAGVDYVAANGSIRFEAGEIAKWITVLIMGEVAADPDEYASLPSSVSLLVQIKKVTGAKIKKKSAIINIIKNILQDPRFNKGDKSAYEVRITYNGYIEDGGGDLKNCPVRPKGYVKLEGILTGNEKVDRDNLVIYTGQLEMTINIDICRVERLPNGEDKFCALQVTGKGVVLAELEMGRYGYIKIQHDSTKHGQFTKSAGGTCYSQIAEERQMVPNESISSVFNGTELPMLKDWVLRKVTYPKQKTAEGEIIVEVLRKIR